jgi:hypothetical protein
MIDNATYPAEGISLLVSRGAQQGHLWAIPDEYNHTFVCNYSNLYSGGSIRPELACRCDFDGDGCAEYESKAYVLYEGTVSLAMRGLTSRLPFLSPVTQLPPRVTEIMKNSSGAEQLNASVSGKIDFIYQINDRSGDDCEVSNYYYATRNISFAASRNFTVSGTKKLFFLRAPVLREQWFRNNRFDVIVLSQSPLFHADLFLNGNRTRNITLRTFDVAAGAYGIQEIVSNLSAPDGWSEAAGLSTPTALGEYNHSFQYAYEFNYSYEGTGENVLALTVYDSGLGSESHVERILSRMLSYDGATTENGTPANSSTARPSFRPEGEYLSSMELVFGILGLLVLLAFVNSWLLK